MPKISSVFGGGFLKSEEIAGKRVAATIESVDVKEFEDGKKLVVHFVGKEKSLVCNKTNANIIAEIAGSDDTDYWEGKRIVLYTKKVEMGGRLVPAIRVELPEQERPAPKPAPKPAADGPVLPGEDGDDIPF